MYMYARKREAGNLMGFGGEPCKVGAGTVQGWKGKGMRFGGEGREFVRRINYLRDAYCLPS